MVAPRYDVETVRGHVSSVEPLIGRRKKPKARHLRQCAHGPPEKLRTGFGTTRIRRSLQRRT